MPRYFFNTIDGGRDEDHVGIELADTASARREAVRFAGAVMADQPDILWDGTRFRVDVLDEDRRLVSIIEMRAIDPPDRPGG
jgi:hypothetical protein